MDEVMEISDVVLLRIETFKGTNHFYLSTEKRLDKCPRCGEIDAYCHGRREIKLFDMPFDGHPAVIHVTRHRFICRVCKGTFFVALPWMSKSHNATNRFISWVLEMAKSGSFCEVARLAGVTEKMIRNVCYGAGMPRRRENVRKVV